MSHYARKGYKVSLMNRNAASTHLWTFQKHKNWNDREENYAQKFVIVEEGEHGRLALNHSKQHAMCFLVSAGPRRSAVYRSAAKFRQSSFHRRIYVVNVVD